MRWALWGNERTLLATGLTEAEAYHFADLLQAEGHEDAYAQRADGLVYPAP